MKKTIFLVSLINVTATSAAPVQWTTGDGANGHWYDAVLVTEGISWNDAKIAAEASGKYLATITSEEENNFVYSLFFDKPEFWVILGGQYPQSVYSGPWIGGTDETEEGTWEWVTGEPWTYENWRAGMPDDFGNQDYLQYRCQPSIAPTWDDNYNYDGNDVIGYITEIPEPTTLSLLALGTLLALKRRK